MSPSSRSKAPTPRKSAAPKTTGNGAARTPRTRVKSAAAPTHQQIAERAYLIHLSRGGHHGRPEDDWLQAERELGVPAARRKRTAKR